MRTDNPELKLFRDTTRQLLADSGSGSTVRDLYASDTAFDRMWWARAAEVGWTALLAPEELGGGSITGSEVADLVTVAREFGQHAAPGPLFPVSTVLAGLGESGVTDAHRDTIENIVAGQQIVTWAYSGDGAHGDFQPGVTATESGAGYVLSGVAERIEAAPQADLLLVTASTPTGLRQFLVTPATAGVTVARARSIDMVRQYGTVRFDNAEVAPAAQVGDAASTPRALERQWQIAVLLRCAETVGILDKAFNLTLQWAFDRYSFGRPIASYQALKHRYATMFMWLQACEAITNRAVAAVQDRDADTNMLLSAAKSYVGEHSVAMLQDCIQLHGGIGVTWEHDLHLYLRRAALNSNTFGTPHDHQLRLADYAERGQAQ